ncbi:hypothetical protein DSM104299_00497 [Baekduia alba]|uniref:DUF6058 family natural product biosynthesis protein n=1 Tax=Baekduia alba TaxID=2997333 RepID=UPI0023422066|nr:DUF6058 family natural product biosynthesis protein [Baekduia alba]WCB91819.1 hypothetical protein DSM104299_00497 [Baekduia alba]
MSRLTDALRERYLALNGRHDITAGDDAYINQHFVPVAAVAGLGLTPDQLPGLMLAGALPLPTYMRSDGELMAAPGLLALATEAGGIERLPAAFGARFADAAEAVAEWQSYLGGRYFACLRQVTPATIRRKDELMATIDRLQLAPSAHDPEWSTELHAAVDELDALELPFTSYDRRRFGGPTSRDRCIDDVRARFPARPQPALSSGRYTAPPRQSRNS